ncbi:hypothetical protein [Pedobacter nototheniae]|nr:hypothetical protein [Pedobacter nototheniae]
MEKEKRMEDGQSGFKTLGHLFLCLWSTRKNAKINSASWNAYRRI